MPSPDPKPSDEGGVKEWIKKQLQALGRALANLAGKAIAALPGIIGSIVSWPLSTLGKAATWLADNVWALVIGVASSRGRKGPASETPTKAPAVSRCGRATRRMLLRNISSLTPLLRNISCGFATRWPIVISPGWCCDFFLRRTYRLRSCRSVQIRSPDCGR